MIRQMPTFTASGIFLEAGNKLDRNKAARPGYMQCGGVDGPQAVVNVIGDNNPPKKMVCTRFRDASRALVCSADGYRLVKAAADLIRPSRKHGQRNITRKIAGGNPDIDAGYRRFRACYCMAQGISLFHYSLL